MKFILILIEKIMKWTLQAFIEILKEMDLKNSNVKGLLIIDFIKLLIILIYNSLKLILYLLEFQYLLILFQSIFFPRYIYIRIFFYNYIYFYIKYLY